MYQNVLATIVQPWIEEIAAGRPYVFQQDSVPAHTTKWTQKWIEDKYYMRALVVHDEFAICLDCRNVKLQSSHWIMRYFKKG